MSQHRASPLPSPQPRRTTFIRAPSCDRCNGLPAVTRVTRRRGEPLHLHWCAGCDRWFRTRPAPDGPVAVRGGLLERRLEGLVGSTPARAAGVV